MKIKSNVRAGSGKSTAPGQVKKSSNINNTVVSYVPPSSRCVGI
jgi:hypothetical protein